METLRYFVGKYCTVCTVGTGLHLTPESSVQYFSGIVEWIGPEGMMIRHPLTDCKSCFFMQHIVGIVEEQALDPNNPKHAEIIKQYKSVEEVKKHGLEPKQEVFAEKKTQGSPWVNPAVLSSMAKKAKEAFKPKT